MTEFQHATLPMRSKNEPPSRTPPALSMTLPSGLSVIGVGVQPPDASWGTLIADGQGLLYSRPVVAVAPGLAVVVTVLLLNRVADALRP